LWAKEGNGRGKRQSEGGATPKSRDSLRYGGVGVFLKTKIFRRKEIILGKGWVEKGVKEGRDEAQWTLTGEELKTRLSRNLRD